MIHFNEDLDDFRHKNSTLKVRIRICSLYKKKNLLIYIYLHCARDYRDRIHHNLAHSTLDVPAFIFTI